MRDQMKIIGFAAAVCLVCSILLAFAATALGPLQARNKANDIKTKVLAVFGEKVLDEKGRLCVSLDELDAVFEERITGIVLDAEGNVLADKKVSELTPREISDIDKEAGLKAFYPVYVYENKESGTKLYAIHVSGKGLWSTIKAYMALETDLSTISGIVFYEHQETPGLGGEVEKPYFRTVSKAKSGLKMALYRNLQLQNRAWLQMTIPLMA